MITIRKKRPCANTSSAHAKVRRAASGLAEAAVAAIKTLRVIALKSISVAVASLGLLFVSTPAKAENYAAIQSYVHSFNNNVRVFSEVFALNHDLSLETSVYGKYTVDFINPKLGEDEGGNDRSLNSTAGAKAVAAIAAASSAVSSGGGGRDTRNELVGGITHNFDNIVSVDLGIYYSHESDYSSTAPSIGLKKDLFNKNTTLSLGYSRNFDMIHGQYMNGYQYKKVDNFFGGITQVLTRYTVAQVGYARINASGYMSEGVRLVPLQGVLQASCIGISNTCAEEVFPNNRFRDAFIAGISQYFDFPGTYVFDRASIKLTGRKYKDSWGIRSYTAEAEYNKYLLDNLIMTLNYRHYEQSKANFDKENFMGTEQFLTASPQLKRFKTDLAELKFRYNFAGNPYTTGDTLKLDSVEGKYAFYNESSDVSANIFMVAVRVGF